MPTRNPAVPTDASGQIRAEEEATTQRMFLDALLDSLLAMVAACDARGNIVLVNGALREYFGIPDDWTAADLEPGWRGVCDRDGNIMPPEETPLLRALAGERVYGADVTLRPLTGRSGCSW